MSIPISPRAAKFLNDSVLPRLDDRQLAKLLSKARRERKRRHLAAEALNERLGGAMRGMANVMAGVTWALLCRASLRASKGHLPVGGKRAASGEMWLPRELLYAVRHQVKERGWHPITAENWGKVSDNFLAEQQPQRAEDFAVQFAIPMARGEARRTVPLDRAFDFSDVRSKA